MKNTITEFHDFHNYALRIYSRHRHTYLLLSNVYRQLDINYNHRTYINNECQSLLCIVHQYYVKTFYLCANLLFKSLA